MTYVISGNRTRIAGLTDTDGHPERAGLRLLGFVSNKKNLQLLRDALPRCSSIDERTKERLLRAGIPLDKYIRKHPEYIHQEDAGKLFRIISTDIPVTMWNRLEDRRFDDWAYVIDFDRGTFEVFKGASRTPLDEDERFYSPTGPHDGIFPPRAIGIYSFYDLPSYPEFLEQCQECETWDGPM